MLLLKLLSGSPQRARPGVRPCGGPWGRSPPAQVGKAFTSLCSLSPHTQASLNLKLPEQVWKGWNCLRLPSLQLSEAKSGLSYEEGKSLDRMKGNSLDSRLEEFNV